MWFAKILKVKINVEKSQIFCDFSFYICSFAMNKLRHSTYLCTPSGNPNPCYNTD